MNILFVASELFPIVKTGGLADVVGSLPLALRQLGDDVRVMLPAYRGVADHVVWPDVWVPFGDPLGVGEVRIGLTKPTSVLPPVYLVDCPALFDREGGPYLDLAGGAWADNHVRFALLARAAAMLCEIGPIVDWRPDVVHAHDWHAGLVPAYLALRAGHRPATVFTIHNLSYTGNFPSSVLPAVGLPRECFTMAGVEFHGELSFMKAGLNYSDHITTVSQTYAKEILKEAQGYGFAGLLQSRRGELTGIVNGIDNEIWDPATDCHIEAPFDARRLDRKSKNKTVLQREMGLLEQDGPLFGVISRLSSQKGLDLVLKTLDAAIAAGAQWVILGSGEPELETAFLAAARKFPDSLAVRVVYDEALAHRIQAGADVLVVPSRFEPCGLTQLYAQRYGTLPLVRRTGGLADTVVDVAEGAPGTGFVFNDADAAALNFTLQCAIELFGNRRKWRTIQRHAMKQDFGWRVPASQYRELYRILIENRATALSE